MTHQIHPFFFSWVIPFVYSLTYFRQGLFQFPLSVFCFVIVCCSVLYRFINHVMSPPRSQSLSNEPILSSFICPPASLSLLYLQPCILSSAQFENEPAYWIRCHLLDVFWTDFHCDKPPRVQWYKVEIMNTWPKSTGVHWDMSELQGLGQVQSLQLSWYFQVVKIWF